MHEGHAFGPALRALAAAVPADRPALIHGERRIDWGELDRLTDDLAAELLAVGLKSGDAVGQQLRNSPDYMLIFFACAKAGLVPVNVNWRYRGAELADIVRRFRIRALVTEAEFLGVVGEARAAGADIGPVWVVGEGGTLTRDPHTRHSRESGNPASSPSSHAPERQLDPRVRGDDGEMFYVATGGTTGSPKAVVWRQQDAWAAFQLSVWPGATLAEPPTVAASLAEHVALATADDGSRARSPLLMLSPLMHGAGLFTALINLLRGGTLVTLPAARFDPDEAIEAVARHGIVSLSFVGDAFALPLADALERRTDTAEKLASLRYIGSSGAVFSDAVKARLCAVQPRLVIFDALGSSEAAGTAVSVTTAQGRMGGGFGAIPGRAVKVFDEAMRELPPGSEAYGILARSGPLPLGYLGEDEINARTFPVVDGVRYLMTGDRARIAADGRIEFAGRDNLVINTGGEKVFAEEVEAVICACPGVEDARVMGLPDPRFGKKVAAVVRGSVTLEALEAHCRERLAGYKVPRVWAVTGESLRLNNGKPDYAGAMRILNPPQAPLGEGDRDA